MSSRILVASAALLLAHVSSPSGAAQTEPIQDGIEKILREIRAKEAAHQKEVQALRAELQQVKDLLKAQVEGSAKVIEELTRKLLEQEKREREALKAATATVDAMQERTRLLEKRLKEALVLLAKAGTEALPKQQPEPPDKAASDLPKLKGKVTKVESAAGVVEINLGSDHGLKVGQMLEAYRLSPQASYLGSLRILQVTPTRSVARQVQSNPLQKKTIMVGDEVASSLSP